MTNFLGYLELYNKRGGAFINAEENHRMPPKQLIVPSNLSGQDEIDVAIFNGRYTLGEQIFTMDNKFEYIATLSNIEMTPERVKTIIGEALIRKGISATVKTQMKYNEMVVKITVS